MSLDDSLVCPLDYRYGRKEMKKVFSEEYRLQNLLKVEAALAQAHAQLGEIPDEAAKKIGKKATLEYVKLERVKEIEAETRHDLMAVVKALTEQCDDAGKYVHLGATSYDIIDTANALQFSQAIDLIIADLDALKKALLTLAEKYKKTIMVGRTHGQFAVPMTFGLKMAVFALETKRHRDRLIEAKKRICAGKMSGAVGTGAAFGKNALKIQRIVMSDLGISEEEAATQIVQRDRHAEFACLLANIAASMEKFATEIRNLQRSEINEVAESFEQKKQVGSSTMAQKKNPITCEKISGLARIVRSFVTPAFENCIMWHERDLSNSSSERFIFSHACILTDEIVYSMTDVFERLEVYPEKMRENLERSKGLVMAESVMMALTAKGMGRQDAHEAVRKASLKAEASGGTLFDALKDDSIISRHLDEKELKAALDYENYTGSADKIVDRVIRLCR